MIRIRNIRLLGVLALVLALVATGAACGEDKEVGSDIEAQGGGDAALRDPERTTTTKAADAAAATTTTGRPTTTTRPVTTTTRQVLEIKIQDDQQGKPFEPQLVTTRAGRLVRWVNVGNTDRQVIAENNAFRSPPIKPGGTYEWVARPGQYNYTDGVRPYASGTINVQ